MGSFLLVNFHTACSHDSNGNTKSKNSSDSAEEEWWSLSSESNYSNDKDTDTNQFSLDNSKVLSLDARFSRLFSKMLRWLPMMSGGLDTSALKLPMITVVAITVLEIESTASKRMFSRQKNRQSSTIKFSAEKNQGNHLRTSLDQIKRPKFALRKLCHALQRLYQKIQFAIHQLTPRLKQHTLRVFLAQLLTWK